jgi:hypothetical protein
MDNNFKVVLLHGYTDEQAYQIMRAIKSLGIEPENTAFATTTPSNLEWKVTDLIEHLSQEHEYMKVNRRRDPESSL